MATPESRKAFGNALRTTRKKAGLTTADVAQALSERGHRTTASNVGAWERGQYVPRDPKVVDVLADIVSAGTELHDTLGFQHGRAAGGQDYNSRITRLSPEAQRVIDTIIEAEEQKLQG